MSKEFIDELDRAHRGHLNRETLTAYHTARAQICLYDEVYRLREAIHAAKDVIQSSSEDASKRLSEAIKESTDAINNASNQNTKLGRKVFALNIILVIATVLGVAFAGLKIYQEMTTTSNSASKPAISESAMQGALKPISR